MHLFARILYRIDHMQKVWHSYEHIDVVSSHDYEKMSGRIVHTRRASSFQCLIQSLFQNVGHVQVGVLQGMKTFRTLGYSLDTSIGI